MVWSTDGDCGSKAVYKRRRMNSVPRPAEVTPAQQRKTDRHRKQKLMSRFSDSGFEEDLVHSPISSPARTALSSLRLDEPEDRSGQLSDWYLHYGDIGYQIQRRKEAQFHPCKSLAHQPQVGFPTLQLVIPYLSGFEIQLGFLTLQ